MVRKFPALVFFLILSCGFSHAELGATQKTFVSRDSIGIRAQSFGSANRAEFIWREFVSSLKKSGARAGVMLLVTDGKILKISSSDFFAKDKKDAVSNATPLPLGKTSICLYTLDACADKSIKLDKPVDSFCSLFRLAGGRKDISLRQLFSMRAGLPASADILVAQNLRDTELFDFCAQIAPFSSPDLVREDSALSIELATMAIAYAKNPSSRDLKKDYLKKLRKDLFAPLVIKDVKLCGLQNPLFMRSALALSPDAVAKWLMCELAKNPPIADAEKIASRRISKLDADRTACGWLSTSRKNLEYFVCGDEFLGCANIVAVYPKLRLAAAFFAVGKGEGKYAKHCALALEKLNSSLLNPKDFK